MKFVFTILLICAIFFSSANSVRHTLTNAQRNSLNALKKQKGTWASFMLDLAEMHVQSGGPLDELLGAIEGVVTDLDTKLEKAHQNYEKRTDEHESEVKRIQSLMDSANSDIASTTEYLQVLAAQEQAQVQDIANLEREIAENQENTESAINERAAENATYQQKVPEHSEAIAAIEEALEVLSQLQGGGASFAQVKKIQNSFNKIQNKIKKGEDRAFLTALMSVATSAKFADRAAVQRVADIMNEVKNNLMGALALLNETEEQQVADHAAALANYAKELAQFQLELTGTQEGLAQTRVSIEDAHAFLQQRQNDLVSYTQDLADEHTQFEEDTKIYNDLVAQFQNELKACKLAQDHLSSAEFAGYIGERMDSDVIIDQPHGDGIAVESKPFQV